jgi:hypothetical protein
VNDKYLYELEKNLELQATSFLLQKESNLLQSQIRMEQFQIQLLDRIRAKTNKTISIEVKDKQQFTGILREVASDHICLEIGFKEFIIPIWAITAVKELENKSQKASILQSKWNFQSSLRSIMIEEVVATSYCLDSKIFSGKITAVYLDHFEIITELDKYAIYINNILFVSRDKDFDY